MKPNGEPEVKANRMKINKPLAVRVAGAILFTSLLVLLPALVSSQGDSDGPSRAFSIIVLTLGVIQPRL